MLRSRLLLLHLAIWLVGVLAGVLLVEQHTAREERRLEQAVGERIAASTEAASEHLIRALAAVEALHDLVDARMRQLATNNPTGAAAFEAHIGAVVETGKFGVLQVAAISPSGMLEWSTAGTGRPVYLGDREYVRIVAEGAAPLSISAPLLERATGRWSIQVARAIRSAGREPVGVAVVSLDPVRLSASLGALRLASSETVAVVRTDGQLIAHSRDLVVHLEHSPIPSHPALDHARTAAAGQFRGVNPIDGQEVVFDFRTLADVPLLVIVRADWTTESRPLGATETRQRWWVALAGALSLIAILVAAQRRRAEAVRLTLAEAEARRLATDRARAEIERLVEGSPAALYSGRLIDGRLVIDFVSANALRVTGWPAERIAGPSGLHVLIEDADEELWPAFRAAVLREGNAERQFRLRQPDGSWRWILERVRTGGAAAEGVVAVIGNLSDVSRTRQIEAQAVAAAKLSALGEMAAGIAHEMNQPLAVMALAAENAADALQGGPVDTAEAEAAVETIARQVRRCTEIATHLRQFGRPQEGGRVEPVGLAAIIESAALLTGGTLRGARIALRVELPAGLPDVLAVGVMVEQVFVNLLLNAYDALVERPPGSLRRIDLAAEAGEGCVVVRVADTGGGIAPSALDRLFEPFFTTKGRDKGTGLGLPICHAAMRSFGGSITALNRGEGAEFTLVFRAAPEAAPRDRDRRPECIGASSLTAA